MTDFKYKTNFNLEQRKEEADRILRNYKNRIPIICESAPNSNIPPLKKVKYLVPSDMTLSQFQFIIRKTIDLNQDSAIYLFAGKNKTLAGDKTMMDIYNIYKDKQDNFLYLHYTSELTWG